jgi:hypothetical protein
MIIDATKPHLAPEGSYTMADVPGHMLDRVAWGRDHYFNS